MFEFQNNPPVHTRAESRMFLCSLQDIFISLISLIGPEDMPSSFHGDREKPCQIERRTNVQRKHLSMDRTGDHPSNQ